MDLSNLPGIRVSGNRYGGASQRTVDGGRESKGITEINSGPSPFDLTGTGGRKPGRHTVDQKDKENAHLYQKTNAKTLAESAKLLAACNMLSKSKKKSAPEENHGPINPLKLVHNYTKKGVSLKRLFHCFCVHCNILAPIFRLCEISSSSGHTLSLHSC
ncbi:MAG: hypothetical protein ACOYN2_03735 [Patescibacteria group bacterium]